MSAMKPDEWRYTVNNVHTFYAGEKPPDDAYDEGTLVPMFTLATVRKWLEELSETVIAAGTIYDMKDDLSDIGADAEGIFRAMIAAKLREIGNDT